MSGEVIPLGERLKRRREELGLSQTQAAGQLEVARTAYRLWEMEAARPSPERWRGIAKWLGVSVTALLLAAEMLDDGEAIDADQIAARAGLSANDWDIQSGASDGDYFSQQRAMIADQARSGMISASDAARLGHVVARVQEALSDAADRWHPGRFTKRFPSARSAPTLARAALAAAAVGIPADTFDAAALLTGELVTNAFKHSGSEWIEVDIALDSERLRIAVSDAGRQTLRPRTPDLEGGWGLALVAELATRWGVDRQAAGKTVWVEFDLTAAGEQWWNANASKP